MATIQIKRIYEPAESSDGFRVLVDRIWPRGVSKEEAKLNLWAKDIAPTTELREDFHHDEESWADFQKDYKKELAGNPAVATLVDELKDKKTITLLFGSKDTEHNNAVVLAELLKNKL